jgi:hypothetical protein
MQLLQPKHGVLSLPASQRLPIVKRISGTPIRLPQVSQSSGPRPVFVKSDKSIVNVLPETEPCPGTEASSAAHPQVRIHDMDNRLDKMFAE